MQFFESIEGIISSLQEQTQDKEILKAKFIQKWIDNVKNFYNCDSAVANKYILRQQLLSIKGMINMIHHTYNGLCNNNKLKQFERYVRLKNCHNYHVYDIEQIFQVFVKNLKNGNIECKQCNIVSNIQKNEIVPDYLSYLFFQISIETPIQIEFDKKKITIGFPEDEKTEIIQSQNRTIISYKNEQNHQTTQYIITLFYNNYSATFKDIISKNPNINQALKAIRYGNNRNLLRQSGLQRGEAAFSNLHNVSINIVSLITGKRMRAGVLHQDCKHLSNNIYIFDIEGLLLSLFKYTDSEQNESNPKQSVKCIYCSSEFTTQNLIKKAMFFQQINNILSIQPHSSGRIYFTTTLITNNQQTIIRIKQNLERRNPKSEKLKEGMTDIMQRAVAFWNNQNVKIINKKLLKVKQQIKENFKKTINYQKIFYPVRCIRCKSIDFVDLWDELIHFVELKTLETNYNYSCLVCGKNYKQDIEELQQQIYLDIQVYTLMQYDLKKIIYSVQQKRWLPDISDITFRERVTTNHVQFVIQYLEMNGKVYNKNDFSYYKQSFNIEQKTTNESQCFVLKECISSVEGSDLLDHVIFMSRGNKECKFKCPKCLRQPKIIFDVLYDRDLSNNVKQGYVEWNKSTSQFYHHMQHKKIRKVFDDPFHYIKEMFKDQYMLLPKAVNNHEDQAWNIKDISNSGGLICYTTGLVNRISLKQN